STVRGSSRAASGGRTSRRSLEVRTHRFGPRPEPVAGAALHRRFEDEVAASVEVPAEGQNLPGSSIGETTPGREKQTHGNQEFQYHAERLFNTKAPGCTNACRPGDEPDDGAWRQGGHETI